jgi:hypothetical protein
MQGFAVPMEFHGVAAFDTRKTRLRFAGYPKGARDASTIVICEVSVETLKLLGTAPVARGDDLLDVFEKHKDIIFRAASKLFDMGDHRPTVTYEDLRSSDQV